jgi:hypothetical protein
MNSTNDSFNLTIFTNVTKKLCLCSAISIFIIFLFVISPLSNFFRISLFMKLIALVILGYTIYLNINQTNSLRSALSSSNNKEVTSQLNMNLICSYIFTVFIGLLFIFVIKSFF